MELDNTSRNLLVLPVLNEMENLQILLPRIRDLFPGLAVLIIDDNSQDGTDKYLDELISSGNPIKYLRRPKKNGIGNAHLDGLSYGIEFQFDYVITMDADLTHRPEDLIKFLDMKDSPDLLIGSRYLDGSNMVGWSIFRRVLTSVGHFVTYLAFARDWDMSSGMRKYRTSRIPIDYLRLNCPPDYAYFFTSAITYKKLSLSVTQIPIQLDRRHSGESKMSFDLMYRGIKLLFLYAFRFKKIRVA